MRALALTVKAQVLERGQTLQVAESGEGFHSMVPADIQLLQLGAGLWTKRGADKIKHGREIHMFKDQNMDEPASPAKELIAL